MPITNTKQKADGQIESHRKLTERVHAAGGKIAAQIYHAGRETSSAVTGVQPVAPSAVREPSMPETPRELTIPEIHTLVEQFGDCAKRAKAAGFDAVEVHGAHGYLAGAFASPFSNKRSDEYGGTIRNRARFGMEIIRNIKEKCGKDYPVLYRISSVEYVPGGLDIEESKVIARLMEEAGADCIHCSQGVYAGKIAEGENIRFLFVNLTEITYTSSVLPPLILVALLSKLEKFLNKHLPELIKSLFTPLICLAALVPLTIVVIGPLIQWLSNGVAAGYNLLYQMAPPIAGAVVGGVWQVIVIFGIHWGMVPIVIANFAQNGQDTLQIFIQIAVISQMAAAFGVFLKAKDKQLRTDALSAGITGIFGITEPAIYGITLPRKKPFIYGCIWAAIESAIAAILGATQYVYAGLPGLISVVNSISVENPGSFPACATGAAVTITGTIGSILLFGCEPKQKENAEHSILGQTVFSPLTGELKSLKDVNDPTFSEEILGKGIAILPKEGIVYAPFDGVVSALFDTKHAIGLTDDQGMELLIHVGLETVNLGGTHFEVHISQGDLVKKGDPLITFDLQEIQKTHDVITPVLITNADDFSEIVVQKEFGPVKAGDAILTVKK